MVKLTTRAAIPHGVVFIYDPTTCVDALDDTSAWPVLHTSNCVSNYGGITVTVHSIDAHS